MPEQQDSSLPVVAWRWMPSEYWGEYVVTCRPGDALMAKEICGVAVEALVRQADAQQHAAEQRRSALQQAYDAMFSVSGDKATLFDAQTAIRKLMEAKDA